MSDALAFFCSKAKILSPWETFLKETDRQGVLWRAQLCPLSRQAMPRCHLYLLYMWGKSWTSLSPGPELWGHHVKHCGEMCLLCHYHHKLSLFFVALCRSMPPALVTSVSLAAITFMSSFLREGTF